MRSGNQRAELLLSQCPLPSLGAGALHAGKRIGGDETLFLGPSHHTMCHTTRISLAGLVPGMAVNPLRDVKGLELADQPLAAGFGELLAVEAIVAVGVRSVALLCKAETSLDQVCHARIGDTRRFMPGDHQLVEFLLGGLFVLAALSETDLLSGDGDHPPAGVLVKPNFVGTRHTATPRAYTCEERLALLA